jgi:excisionase family DNA binding protein
MIMEKVILTSLSIEELTSIIQKTVSNEISKKTEPTTDDNNTFMTRSEVCDFLNISLPTLNKWTKTGKINGHRIGLRSVRYKKEDVISSLTQIRTILKG